MHTPKHIDEGMIKGKKVYLFLIIPSLIIFLMALAAWGAFALYAKKFVVNDNPEICNLVRRQYRSTINNEHPCHTKNEDSSYLVTFTLNPNDVSSVPALMSFRVDMVTKKVEPAISQ